jgi:hypothetical protein
MVMTSTAKILANRANAQKSTGPQTERGKRMASLNALSSSLHAKTRVLPHEDPYRRLTERLYDELQPRGVIEEELVDHILSDMWRLRRLEYAENVRLRQATEVQAIRRHHAADFRKIRNQTFPRPLREDREQDLIDTAPQIEPIDEDLAVAMSRVVSDLKSIQALALLDRLRRSLTRTITQTLADLERRQERRRKTVIIEQPDPNRQSSNESPSPGVVTTGEFSLDDILRMPPAQLRKDPD